MSSVKTGRVSLLRATGAAIAFAAVSLGAAAGRTAIDAASANVAAAATNATAANATAASAVMAALLPDAWPAEAVGTLRSDVFALALKAARCAIRSGQVGTPATLTVIDYSRPSTDKRLWVFDLVSRALLDEELVAHGQGSGGNVPTLFSNENESHQSSIGLFVTKDTYVGKNGYSLRLDGLDAGFNDRASERAIVMHGAPYVSDAFARAQGRLGRSWGCPALREAVARKIIDTVKGGGLVFAYYPNDLWLQTSKYLGSCGTES